MNTANRQSRRGKLLELMDRHGVRSIALRRPPNFAWYTGGADNRVDHSSEFGVADIVVTGDGDYLVANNIEAARITQEGRVGFEVLQFPWYESPRHILHELSAGCPMGTDFLQEDTVDLTNDLQGIRCTLDSDAIQQYMSVGADTMEAMSEVDAHLRPGISEWEAAAELEARCRRRGLYTPVIMAAGDSRIANFRHPVLFENQCKRRIMFVVCAERHGLYANLTRFVDFEDPDPTILERSKTCESILLRMRDVATQRGHTLADALEDCKSYYAEAGYPGEWQLHHQGGLTGYATREIVATPATDWTIAYNQAFSWNPSITGAKAEETFILTESGPTVVASFVKA